MTIQYMSDLHLEYKDNYDYLRLLPFKVAGDILVIAGDVSYFGDVERQGSFLWQWASDNFRQTLIVAGNHEYYGGYDILSHPFSWECRLKPNVRYYQNKVVTIDDTDFILSTLWSRIPDESMKSAGYFLNDFHRITYSGNPFTPEDYNDENARCRSFIRNAVAASHAKKRVVVTHHVPTRLCLPPYFRKGRLGKLQYVIVDDLTDYICSSDIDVWIYGHSHAGIDANINGTRIVSNQLGYVYRKEHLYDGFDFCKTISL